MRKRQDTLVVLLFLLGFMFAVLGFAAGVNAFFIPFVKDAFKISTGMSYLVMTATYSAFILFGIPSGLILKKIGYKGGMVIGTILIGFGFLIIGLSGMMANFPVFLVALFVSGMGQSLLMGAQSTYIVIIGSRESALRRGALMGICHKTSFAAASLILSGFLDLTNVRIEDVITPFYIMSGIMVFLGVIIAFFVPLPEVNEESENQEPGSIGKSAFAGSKTSIFQFPHLFLGFFALFLYIGGEFIAMGSINDYATALKLPHPANYVWLASGGMVVGYVAGIILTPKYISMRQASIVCSYVGITTTILIYITPDEINIYMVGLLGLANSLLYTSIWTLAIADLGKSTKMGTSVLVMSITGGAIIPLLFGHIVELYSYRIGYLICLPIFVFILYYTMHGCRVRNAVFQEAGVSTEKDLLKMAD